MSKRTYTNKDFVVKDIWDQKTGTREDGSIWTVQKILNEDDKSLVIWDHKADMKDILQIGKKYHAKGVTIKQNQDGYDEYHTGQYSVITPLKSRANEEFFHESEGRPVTAFNASTTTIEAGFPVPPKETDVPSYTKKDLHDAIRHIENRLDYIIKKLDQIELTVHNFKEMI